MSEHEHHHHDHDHDHARDHGHDHAPPQPDDKVHSYYQILGIALKELLIEKLFRDARASMIEDGSNDILSLTAAQKILDQYVI